MPKCFQNYAVSSAKISAKSSVSVLILVHGGFELILFLWKSGVWIEAQSSFVARCFLLLFIFSCLILHRLFWALNVYSDFRIGLSIWTYKQQYFIPKIKFSCSAHESARIAMESKGVARHLYILYTVGNAWSVRSSEPKRNVCNRI